MKENTKLSNPSETKTHFELHTLQGPHPGSPTGMDYGTLGSEEELLRLGQQEIAEVERLLSSSFYADPRIHSQSPIGNDDLNYGISSPHTPNYSANTPSPGQQDLQESSPSTSSSIDSPRSEPELNLTQSRELPDSIHFPVDAAQNLLTQYNEASLRLHDSLRDVASFDPTSSSALIQEERMKLMEVYDNFTVMYVIHDKFLTFSGQHAQSMWHTNQYTNFERRYKNSQNELKRMLFESATQKIELYMT